MRRGELGEARGRLLRALTLVQQFDDRSMEAGIWWTLADLAVQLGRPEASAPLRAISVLPLRPVQTPDAAREAEDGYQQLQALARQSPIVEGAEGLLVAAARAYAADKGLS